MRRRRLPALSRPTTKLGAGRLILGVSRDDERRSRDAGAQQIVEVHDADRPVRIHDDQRGDLRRIEQLQRLAAS